MLELKKKKRSITYNMLAHKKKYIKTSPPNTSGVLNSLFKFWLHDHSRQNSPLHHEVHRTERNGNPLKFKYNKQRY